MNHIPMSQYYCGFEYGGDHVDAAKIEVTSQPARFTILGYETNESR